jgi:hypothetical protein
MKDFCDSQEPELAELGVAQGLTGISTKGVL